MKKLKYPSKSLYQNELNLEDEIIASEEDYHTLTLEIIMSLISIWFSSWF